MKCDNVKKYLDELLDKDSRIDTIILGCTHYPLLLPKIKKYVPEGTKIVAQGEIVAQSLQDYLDRHTDMESLITKGNNCEFFTTESVEKFRKSASVFLKEKTIHATRISLE